LLFTGMLAGAAVASGRSDSDFVRAGVPLLVGLGGSGFLLKFGRNDELEADALGMRYMARAGYDPAAQRDVMNVLEEATRTSGGRGMELFSTHPYPETRIKKIEERLAREYPPESRAGLVRRQDRFHASALSRLPSPK